MRDLEQAKTKGLMMTWHLKDRTLESVLEKYSDGNFVKALNFAIERDWIDAANVVTVEFDRKFLSRGYTNDFSFRTDELEDISEYNPNDWNEYPKVTPPFDKDMRVELDDGLRYCARYHKFSDGCFWVGTNGTCFPKYLNDKVVRFRPWED